ncbi:MAG: Hsp70 family protein [Kofleriaceae bacterium]
MDAPARYLIGIDLGTTNSAVAYVDARAGDDRVRTFAVPQLVAPGDVAERGQLPSFVYLAGDHDLAPHETALPWDAAQPSAAPGARRVVGELARAQGARMAHRMIASAKSWLCHPGVDRQAAILPWGAGADDDEPAAAVPKLSPVAAQAQVLAHIRAAWDHAFADEDVAAFADQEVVVTVPASFDEAARELTLQAAAAAGYPPVVLLEEPQAAFYAWLAGDHPRRTRPAAGEHVLVFDVGGGTSDFTLITVDADGDGFARTAVGDHVLLGGDNVDLTLAKRVEQRLTERAGKPLDAMQWHALVHACRLAKERLLADDGEATTPIVVAGRGTRLIGGTLKDEITRAELDAVLLDGFFPEVAVDAPLARARGGLQEFGLPYAADPAVTRHLAQFLGRHGRPRIDCVLFNGGAMTPTALRQRGARAARGVAGQRAARAAPQRAPELAVAQGAAYYGLVRRGQATRIKGGTPRAYYIGVEGEGRERFAVCLAGKGLEDGATVALERDFRLVTNRPVSFRLYSSSSRADASGALVPIGDGRADTVDDGSDLLELPPIVTVLRARGKAEVTVRLEVHISELGALEIYCREVVGGRPWTPAPATPGKRTRADSLAEGAPAKWKLAFDMRSGGAAPAEAEARSSSTMDAASPPTDEPDPRLPAAKAAIAAAFAGGGPRLAGLTKELEGVLEARRDEWSLATARALFDALLADVGARRRSADAEQRWLGLAGFCLRPGVGASLDGWRGQQMWGLFLEGLAFPRSEPGRLAWWITFRRVAGGLTKGHQEQLIDRLGPALLPGYKQQKKLAELRPSKQELAEIWRTVASLERIPVGVKGRLGDELVRQLEGKKAREDGLALWALGRIGARVPMYGPLNGVVPPSQVAGWIDRLVGWDWPEPERAAFPLAQLGRRTGDRSRDLPDATRARLVAALRGLPGGERAAVLVEQVVALEAREERVALGDTLPAGLRLVGDDERPPEATA